MTLMEKSFQWSTSFFEYLADWFDFDRKSQETPTARNPFVLGYGIYQRLPPTPGTRLFIPGHFQFTTSTNDHTVATSKSTINFTITNEDDRRLDLKTDGNGENWQPSLMVQAGLNRDEADGVMVYSFRNAQIGTKMKSLTWSGAATKFQHGNNKTTSSVAVR